MDEVEEAEADPDDDPEVDVVELESVVRAEADGDVVFEIATLHRDS